MNRPAPAVVWTVAALVGVVAVASFALSASALVAVAGWAGVDGRLAWCVPVLTDGGALAFSLAALVRRGQGRGAGVEWCALGVLAVVSVAANTAHGLGAHVPEAARVAVGVLVVGLAPVVVLVATHTLAALLAPGTAEDVDVAAEEEPVAPDVAFVADDVADDAEEEPIEVEDTLAAMQAMRSAGATLREVGAAFGCHASTVARRLRDTPVEEDSGALLTTLSGTFAS
ncbi:uncharacterized protein DUF2637 [Isoptericola jiangsuensis]|uniref:Uncharacterized protein DUF2637 n=1 Tax=Isoptericola jiangsuensis TaxID=548579 RepID=A0A2A9F052_9MICO|nr:helix-turn-helix domain-containing protein [Isoptericola jiangsuensis]PFG44161.1 uncharacterized protein DUF2637 [Isoptericola jiangsuensis]